MRRLIYTTNPIESYHRMVRKVTKTKGAFTSGDAIIKQISCDDERSNQMEWNYFSLDVNQTGAYELRSKPIFNP